MTSRSLLSHATVEGVLLLVYTVSGMTAGYCGDQ